MHTHTYNLKIIKDKQNFKCCKVTIQLGNYYRVGARFLKCHDGWRQWVEGDLEATSFSHLPHLIGAFLPRTRTGARSGHGKGLLGSPSTRLQQPLMHTRTVAGSGLGQARLQLMPAHQSAGAVPADSLDWSRLHNPCVFMTAGVKMETGLTSKLYPLVHLIVGAEENQAQSCINWTKSKLWAPPTGGLLGGTPLNPWAQSKLCRHMVRFPSKLQDWAISVADPCARIWSTARWTQKTGKQAPLSQEKISSTTSKIQKRTGCKPSRAGSTTGT